jgi:ATP-dependent RNA helicase DeaD
LETVGPQRIAAAFLRQQLAVRPVPEELIPLSIEHLKTTRPARDGGPRDQHAPTRDLVREPRGPDMQGGVWFTISLGRKQRADPKFLLPMICNAGKVVKRDVGSIKIEDTVTRFEISADRAVAFAEQLKQPGSLERGIMIAPAGKRPEQPKEPRPKFNKAGKPAYKRQDAVGARGPGAKKKARKPKQSA